MIDYKIIIRNRDLRLKLIYMLRFIPTKPYLRLVYWAKTGKKLDLKNPVGFNEKENWLKLYDVHPEYTQLADKYRVREYIKDQIGEEHLFPLLGKWDKFEEIDFDKLPNQFVLKCNHDSGSVKVIRDKSQLTEEELKKMKKFFSWHLRRNPFYAGREYPYRNIKPCIIAEKYMVPEGESDIEDYKFFCFDGEPKIMFIATDRSIDVKFDFFDMDFNHLDIVNCHPNAEVAPKKPACFDEMVKIAKKLSQGMKFVRLDLYQIEGKVYFGEFTFYHAGGFYLFHPSKWENELGDWIKI